MSATTDPAALASAALASLSASATDTADLCDNEGGGEDLFGVRVASIFVILATSLFGCLLPVLTRRTKLRNIVPVGVFEFAKYFGSGVIIATSFIHLLSPGIEELTAPCLGDAWQEYPYPLGICMASLFSIFFVELAAFRWGTAKLKKIGVTYISEAGGHCGGPSHQQLTHGPDEIIERSFNDSTEKDLEKDPKIVELPGAPENEGTVMDDSALAQILGVAILEFGVLLHSVLIGLTLAVSTDFKVLFIVLVFHQMFEGLGVGTRLAFLKLPVKYNFVPIVAAIAFAITTPIGISIGLGVRQTYNPNSQRANIVSGILDSTSAGILIYTGLVELLAHEFLFNKEMKEASTRKLVYSCTCMIAGAGIMALLGRWA